MVLAYKILNVKYQQKLMQIKRLIYPQIKAAFRYSGYFDEKIALQLEGIFVGDK